MTVRVTGIPPVAAIGTSLTINGATLGSNTLAVNGTAAFSGSLAFTGPNAGIVLKQGVDGLVGTFVLNGATPVTVSNRNVAISDAIILSLNTVGGTVGTSAPNIRTITAGTGFTVAGIALDTSTYNYAIIRNAA